MVPIGNPWLCLGVKNAMAKRHFGIRDLLHAPVIIGAVAIGLVVVALFRACVTTGPATGSRTRMERVAASEGRGQSASAARPPRRDYSATLGVALRGDEDEALLREVCSWLGTPYRGGMAKKGVGTDCSGFVQRVFDDVYGIKLGRSSTDIAKQITPVKRQALRCGHIVVFSRGGAAKVFHVGIYLGDSKFIHSASGGGKGITVSSLQEDYYAKHFYAGGPAKGMR